MLTISASFAGHWRGIRPRVEHSRLGEFSRSLRILAVTLVIIGKDMECYRH